MAVDSGNKPGAENDAASPASRVRGLTGFGRTADTPAARAPRSSPRALLAACLLAAYPSSPLLVLSSRRHAPPRSLRSAAKKSRLKKKEEEEQKKLEIAKMEAMLATNRQ